MPTKPPRQDVKAILDYLAARQINLAQAQQQIKALGLPLGGQLSAFLAGHMSYQDVFTSWGV